MPVDPSGVTTDDHDPDGGGPERNPNEIPGGGRGPIADPRAGLPPVAGDPRLGGNGSNGHDEAGLPPAGDTRGTDRDDERASTRQRMAHGRSGEQIGAPTEPAWAAPTAAGTDAPPPGGAREPGAAVARGGDGELPPGEIPPAWSSGAAPSAAPVAPATVGAAPAPFAAGTATDAGPGASETATESAETGAAGAPGPRRVRKYKARRGLRVRQRLWSIDPWSMFKLSALFYICVCGILLVAGTLLWNVGRSVGTIDDIESFITRMGAYGTCTLKAEVPAGTEFEEDDDCADGEVLVGGYKFDDGTIFRMAGIGGGILVVAGSIGNVLMVVLLNLLNELTGGLRYTVVKEPLPRPQTGRQRGPRFAGARAIARRSGGPRHTAGRGVAAPRPEDVGPGVERIRVPAAELSTDPGPQR